MNLNLTHDPSRRSWVESANRADTDFPLQNLPFGAFRRTGTGAPIATADAAPRIGIAIGDRVLDLRAAADDELLPDAAAAACRESSLNALMAAGPTVWTALRAAVSNLLGEDTCPPGDLRQRTAACLVPQRNAQMTLPARIGDYTDFYASISHATNVGSMLRPDNPLLPNYKWMPIGYHGRSSSIVTSGTPIRRPHGQLKPADAATPTFGPCRNLDYELELGAFVGPGNPLGERIPLARAQEHIFGYVLLNDWSARDIQTWEYQPLGPFLSKNFASTISPWIVTSEALAPFRAPAFARPAGDPAPLPHLSDPRDAAAGGLNLTLEVSILTAQMRQNASAPHRISRGNFASMYWTVAQMLAHHASNGCNLSPGDLLGSGTISGPTKDSRGCLLELTWRGTEPLHLPDGEERKFLADGDEIIFRAHAEAPGHTRIGFGECRGVILPAS